MHYNENVNSFLLYIICRAHNNSPFKQQSPQSSRHRLVVLQPQKHHQLYSQNRNMWHIKRIVNYTNIIQMIF
jgi:hypothetical protein